MNSEPKRRQPSVQSGCATVPVYRFGFSCNSYFLQDIYVHKMTLHTIDGRWT